jgi:Helicase C-terminal domain/Type III restriction enzyme, res subunit
MATSASMMGSAPATLETAGSNPRFRCTNSAGRAPPRPCSSGLTPSEDPREVLATLHRMPRFITNRERPAVPESPEALFRSLRPTDGAVRHLWAHQADLLRDYQQLPADTVDAALELPTGGGKTLVGLLLAEYRRARGQRVAYLCPNIQLARQAASKATSYGIPAVALTGPQTGYNHGDFLAFNRAQAVAITTYHGVFNSNPRIDAAQTLVLDDAHAGEAAVADLWSVTAERGEGALYDALLANLIEALPNAFAERMRDVGLDPWRRNDVELVPPLAVAARADVLREAIAAHARDHNAYAGSMIADALEHCLVYVSWNGILIRPLIPPTSDHHPFAGAGHRIYMSATLGSGGELERAFGVPRIERLAIPGGWDEHGSGRRFFIFPGAVRAVAEADAFVAQAIERVGRALVIAPSYAELERFETACLDEIIRVRPPQVEFDFDAFTREQRAVLLLANRYDGIDLPDESCRLIVLTGLPAGTHLQERFLYDRLKARRVLAERIRTRIVQGAGRCTRNPQDYAAVIVRSEDLVDFCSRDEHVRAMHPELQAEFAFGLDNCEDPEADLLELLDSFLTGDADWREADADIRIRTADATRQPAPEASELADAAEREVEAWRAAWRGDLRRAVTLAQEATDRLGGSVELRPYRCFWLYLAASWAVELAQHADEADTQLAETLRLETMSCARGISWVPRIEPVPTAARAGAEYNERAARAADRMKRLGIRGLAFEQRLSEIQDQLAQDDATPFELGLTALGELLGFESVRPASQADPDSAWREDEKLWLIFEAKTGESGQNPVSPREVRQAGTHQEWVSNQLGWPAPQRSKTSIVSYKQTIAPEAAAIAGEVCLVSPQIIREVAARTFSAHREIRARARGLSEEQLEAAFAHEFRQRRLHSSTLLDQLGPRRIADG